MNRKFDKPAKCVIVLHTVLWLTLAVQAPRSAAAGEFSRGPLVNLSEPDAFAGCASTLPAFFVGAQLEPSVVVNPQDLDNIVAVWFGEQWKGVAPVVSLDGGISWQPTLVPNLTLCTGGTAQGGGGDPSLSFAPNGDLYFAGGLFTVGSYNAWIVSKSTDGGLHWSPPVFLAESDGKQVLLDKG